MVLVRYPYRSSFGSAALRKELIIKALVLASLCAAVAFVLSAMHERKLAPAAAAAHAPVVTPPKIEIVEPTPQHLSVPERPDRKITEFMLSSSPEFQNLGPIKLRLTGVDEGNGSYNLAARFRGRQYTRTNVKLDQTVKLGEGRKAGPEIVVGAIVQNRAWGYLSEPKTEPQIVHRRYKRR